LSRDELRVHYSGFIIFSAQILSVITGVIFTLLLTRNMTQTEYGVWNNIFDVGTYFTLASGLFPFWAMRFVARRKEGAVKTGLLANLVVALVAAAVYVPIVFPVTMAFQSQAFIVIYLVASLQVVNLYLITMLESCLRAVKPQAIGYGLLIEEVVKVAFALLLIVGLHQLFIGAMLSLIVATAVQALYYIRLLAPELRERVKWGYLGQWVKGSIANVYSAIGAQLVAFIFILLFVSPVFGKAARGDYAAAATFANVIGYASFLSFALYPKLLARNCSENEVGLTFKTVLMLAIPMAVVTLTMPQSLLIILNVSYGTASPILVLLTVDTLIVLIAQFYSYCLMGTEHLDEEGKISLNKLVRSKIFKIFTLPYIQAAIALPIAYYMLTQLPISSPVQAVLYVITINIGVHITTFLGLYTIMRKSTRIAVAWRSIGKYILASIVCAIELLILPNTTTLIFTLGKALIGLATYVAFLLVIDADARDLVTQIWQEIKLTISGLGNNGNDSSGNSFSNNS
jgi:O-antigen/teichoic acid export membrane protein